MAPGDKPRIGWGGIISSGDKPGIGWGWFFMAPGDLYVELLVYWVVTGTVSNT